ncbi:unnamed protein product [Blepharisma stoltei]|uniref:Uncharacterized protein n=1 Tax=Blepharisma stoltei TaxID=1481888 RepID=A0AAU9IAK0_9CILI|nr:unnamed protein product [Blepharisma stoltei]
MSFKAVKSSSKSIFESPSSRLTTTVPSPQKESFFNSTMSSKELLKNLYNTRSNQRRRSSASRQSGSFDQSMEFNMTSGPTFSSTQSYPHRFAADSIPQGNFDERECLNSTEKLDKQAKFCESLEAKLLKEDFFKAKVTYKEQKHREFKDNLEHNKRIDKEFKEKETKRAQSQRAEERKNKKKETIEHKIVMQKIKDDEISQYKDGLDRENKKHALVDQIKNERKEREKTEQQEERESYLDFIQSQQTRSNEEALRERKELAYDRSARLVGNWMKARRRSQEATERLDLTLKLINRYN